ncbi:MAG: hypothetical protein AAF578_02205 [Pseudomonadota bacterium]
MTMPRIIFVPGMKPKPPAEIHRGQLWRCLLEGVKRADPEVAEMLSRQPEVMERANWTWAFYGTYRDIGIDLPGIDALLEQDAPLAEDLKAARSWRNRLLRGLYLVGDAVPFVVDSLANEDLRVTLKDVARYVTNRDGIGDQVRADLLDRLRLCSDRPIMLIGHSLGSVIAWDTLWALTHELQDSSITIDRFVTLGSPLGNRVIQKGLKGRKATGADAYPHNIRRWTNIVAVGELTALDRHMANDYGAMRNLKLVEQIDDIDVYNHYRENGRLHVHSEYGYLANVATGRLIADWWRSHAPG